MMIAARNAMLMSGAKLPYDAEVEYLESTGTQYIETGIYATLDTRVVARVAQSQIANDNAVISMDNGAANNASFTLEYYYQAEVAVSRLGWTLSIDSTSAQYRTEIVDTAGVWHTIAASRDGIVFDGVTYDRRHAGTSVAFLGPYPLIMFAYGRRGMPIIYAQMRLAYCEIYNQSTLVRDFIPVRVGSGSSAVGYLYDRANPTGGPLENGLYPNAGTGAFVIGPDK